MKDFLSPRVFWQFDSAAIWSRELGSELRLLFFGRYADGLGMVGIRRTRLRIQFEWEHFTNALLQSS